MERISIFNYEAFYLDFLEGNLNEEDTLLLLNFLENHPELKLEDEMLVSLDDEQYQLDAQFKSDLKQMDFNETGVTAQNVEKFLIAETEGLLSSHKQNELNQIVGKDASLIQLRKLYSSTRLIADESIVFANKKDLKQNKRIVLWPYLTLAAATIAILLFFWNATTNIVETTGESNTAINKTPTNKDKQNQQLNPIINAPKGSENNNKDQIAPINEVVEENPIVLAEIEKSTNKRTVIPVIKGLNRKQIKLLNQSNNELDIIENNLVAQTSLPTFEKEDEYTMLGFNDMNNPIKPITSRLGDVVKQEVDFRTAKATENQSGGFYLKIGKLEISKRKY